MTMTHPISPFIPAVFVPVRDLKSATEWYAHLLDRQIVPGEYTDGIYIFDFGGTAAILDSNAWGNPPMTMFDTRDIGAAHRYCEQQEHRTLTDVYTDEYVSVFTIDSTMICQANRAGDPVATKPAHALLKKISHVIVHSDNMPESVAWYERLLARRTKPNERFGRLPCIPMDSGADLLIDDNRLAESPRVFFETLQADFRANPIAIMETEDLDAALNKVLSRGAVVAGGIESRLGVPFFIFHDPDGNGFMVCETRS